jgi:hypothetical protein
VYGNVLDLDKFLSMPHYLIICDMMNAMSPAHELQYTAQYFLHPYNPDKPQINKIESLYLDKLFKGFSQIDGKYEMRSRIKKRYPSDV